MKQFENVWVVSHEVAYEGTYQHKLYRDFNDAVAEAHRWMDADAYDEWEEVAADAFDRGDHEAKAWGCRDYTIRVYAMPLH